MKSKYDYDIIRDYLHGLVDHDTARRIRDLIRNDEVARDIAAGILQLEHDFNGNETEIESYIEGLRQKQLKLIDVQGRARASRGWIKLAAAILIIAVSGALLWLTVFNNENLLDKELSQPYPLATIDRGASDANEGYDLYNQHKFNDAIASFNNVTNDASITFYNGLSHLYVGNYDQAITLLGSTSLEASRYRQQASWYRSLALIKAGRNDEARKALTQISNEHGHYKSATALQLLESLD